MVSQRDIAKKLNMTQQAVSAALRSDGKEGTVKVAPETRKLVLETARKMGYRSNRYASVLKGGRSNLIAIFHGTMTNDWIRKLRAVNNAVLASGYLPWTIEIAPGDDKKVPKSLDYVLSAKIEGVIAGGAWFKWEPRWFWDHNVPVVSFQGARLPGVPFFAPDKVEGFAEVLRHLYAQGCRRPMICLATKASASGAYPVIPVGLTDRERKKACEALSGVDDEALMGFERFRRETRFMPQGPFCIHLPEDFDARALQNGFEVGRVLAKRALAHKPDALVFTNDSMAVGGLYGCQEAGLRVPRDLCITGFNGEDPARYSLVPVTTVIQPAEQMAEAAVARLVGMIETKTLKSGEVQRFPCRFEARQSTMYRNC